MVRHTEATPYRATTGLSGSRPPQRMKGLLKGALDPYGAAVSGVRQDQKRGARRPNSGQAQSALALRTCCLQARRPIGR